jgi:hypothetical protein
VGVQHLERHGVVVPDVLGQEDRGHAAAAELALDRVVTGECGVELGAGVGRGGFPYPFASCWNRGLSRSGAKFGSTRSRPGVTV